MMKRICQIRHVKLEVEHNGEVMNEINNEDERRAQKATRADAVGNCNESIEGFCRKGEIGAGGLRLMV